jgi:hypothetical protein
VAHKAFLEFVYEFEILYYKRDLTCLHFIRPCIYALTHIVLEHFRVGSLTELSQWTMEQTIGNLGEEIRLHSDPYANLSQRVVEWARANALYALASDLFHVTEKLPTSACDIGENYVLLGPHKHHEMDALTFEAFKKISDLHRWRIKAEDSLSVDRFARLLLPNGQIARSWWHEKKRPAEKVQISRNVKVSQQLSQRECSKPNKLIQLSLQGASRFSEILYFFLVTKNGLRYTLAAVNMFAEADPRVFNESYGTLHLCRYLGTNGIQIVDAKWIMDVVKMVPFEYTHEETNYSEGTQYFAVEKMSAVLIRKYGTDSFDEEE